MGLEPLRVLRMMPLALATVASLVVMVPAPAEAQCRLNVRPADGILGYRPRAGRCEGMYVELQSAPLNLRVVSLLRGIRLSAFGDATLLRVDVPPDSVLESDSLAPAVAIVAQPIEAGLNWALDGTATSVSPLRWDLTEVFRATGIHLTQIGIAGVTTRIDAQHDPVYVPVSVAGPSDVSATDSIHLIFHLPAASAARVCVVNGPCSATLQQIETGGYYDGYFETALPPGDPGLTSLVVQWRGPTGSSAIGRDRVDIFRW